jgi:transposase
MDSSSVSVEGEYLEKEGEEEGILKITQGYSRDKRPDLKQFMIGSAEKVKKQGEGIKV